MRIALALSLSVALSVGCSSGSGTPSAGGTGGGGPGGTGTGATGGAGNPNGSCSAALPAKGQPADTSNPTTVVGTGTRGELHVRRAADRGDRRRRHHLQLRRRPGDDPGHRDAEACPSTRTPSSTAAARSRSTAAAPSQILQLRQRELSGQRQRPDAAAHRAHQRQDDADRGDPDRARALLAGLERRRGRRALHARRLPDRHRLDLHRQPGARRSAPTPAAARSTCSAARAASGSSGSTFTNNQRQQRRRGRRPVRGAEHLQQPVHGQQRDRPRREQQRAEQVLGDQQRPERDRLGRQRRRDLQRRQRRRTSRCAATRS